MFIIRIIYIYTTVSSNIIVSRQTLLSLLPPSCMVVPIRDLGNITSNTLIFYESTLNMVTNNDINIVSTRSMLFFIVKATIMMRYKVAL